MYNFKDMLDRIKKIKKDRNITNDILSLKTNIPIGTLSKILSGNTKDPQVSNIIKIANCLGVSADYLIFGTDKDSDYYRILLSDTGLKAIQKQLIPRIEAYGIDKFASDIGVEFQDIKQFLSSDLTIGHNCLKKLDDILVVLDTNLYQLITEYIATQNNSDETLFLYQLLDDMDKAEIRGEMKHMLKADKYNKSNTYQAPPREIAAFGADGTKGTRKRPKREIT